MTSHVQCVSCKSFFMHAYSTSLPSWPVCSPAGVREMIRHYTTEIQRWMWRIQEMMRGASVMLTAYGQKHNLLYIK